MQYKQTIRFALSPKDISLLDKNMKSVVEPGVFEILVGSSSEDIRVKKKFVVQ